MSRFCRIGTTVICSKFDHDIDLKQFEKLGPQLGIDIQLTGVPEVRIIPIQIRGRPLDLHLFSNQFNVYVKKVATLTIVDIQPIAELMERTLNYLFRVRLGPIKVSKPVVISKSYRWKLEYPLDLDIIHNRLKKQFHPRKVFRKKGLVGLRVYEETRGIFIKTDGRVAVCTGFNFVDLQKYMMLAIHRFEESIYA